MVRLGRAHALTATTLGWAVSKMHSGPASPKKVPFLVAHELIHDAMVRRAQIEVLRTTHWPVAARLSPGIQVSSEDVRPND